MNRLLYLLVMSCLISGTAYGQDDHINQVIFGGISGVRVSESDGNPGSAPVITVRGISGIRGDNSPLFIVDGAVISNVQNYFTDAFVQYKEQTYTSSLNPLSFLDVHDIESVEILKNSTATALYGSRGADGAVIIKTRRAKENGTSVDWDSDITVTPSVSHSHSINVASMANGISFNVSAFIRDRNESIPDLSSLYGGGRVSLESASGRSVRFGFNSMFAIGNSSNPSGTAYYGGGSQMLAMRGEVFSPTSIEGWIEDYDDLIKDTRSVSSAYLTVDLCPFVKWSLKAGVDLRKNIRQQWYGNGTVFGKANNGAASEMASTTFSYNALTSFDYMQYMSEKHMLKASLGFETFGEMNAFNTMDGTDFFTHELRSDGLSLMQCEKKVHRFDCNGNRLAGHASAGYEYAGIAGIDAGVRTEYSFRYDKKPVFYPYASLSLDLHHAFMNDSRTVSAFGLEGGYGFSGKETAMPYELTGRLLTGGYPSVPSGAEPYHEGLGRVISQGWHAGVHLGFLDDRIMFGASMYSNHITDGYTIYSFGESGKDGLWKRAPRKELYSRTSAFSNWGLELDVDAYLFRRKNFSWTVDLALAYESNQMRSVDDQDMWGPSAGSGIKGNVFVKGHAAGAFCGYLEDADGKIIDTNRDTRINHADKVILGNPVPGVYGNLGMNFRFYGISLDMYLDGCADYEIVNLHALALSGKTDITSSCVESGDFVRLKSVSLGYDIPLKTSWIDRLNIHVSADNLFTLTGYSGWSPDVNSFGPSPLRGYDYGSFPVFRYVVLGISAKF